MSTTTEFDPGDYSRHPLRSVQKPVPLGSSLAASASKLTTTKIKGAGRSAKAEEWQDDAWDMHDLVGEQRFLAHTLAGRMAQARFFVGRLPDNPTEAIEPLEEGLPFEAMRAFAGRGSMFAQMVERLGVNLFIPGDCYLVGLPNTESPADDDPRSPVAGISPLGEPGGLSMDGIDIDSLQWSVRSTSEVSFDSEGQVTIAGGAGREAKTTYNADDIFLIRVWRSHPRYWWQADSPTRSSLPVLRELVGLTMHISAQVDSRLAGAGVFLIPESADRAVRAQAGKAVEGTDAEGGGSPFADALMDAMITPISDRSSASAVVPVMPVVPDDSIDKFRFISFASPLDTEARSLRDEAIRRLALGQDCPPELLLGVGGMNHWGAWLVREDVVTTHLEPPLALICDAITTQYLWPVLEQNGVEDYESYAIWYDVDHLILRPDRSKDAKDLHAAGVLSAATLRDATGFDESDAPEVEPTDPAVALVMDMVRGAPSLAQNPGMAVLVGQVRAMLEGTTIPDLPDDPAPTPPGEEDPSATPGDTPEGAGPPAESGPGETSPAGANGGGLAASANPSVIMLPAFHEAHPTSYTYNAGGLRDRD